MSDETKRPEYGTAMCSFCADGRIDLNAGDWLEQAQVHMMTCEKHPIADLRRQLAAERDKNEQAARDTLAMMCDLHTMTARAEQAAALVVEMREALASMDRTTRKVHKDDKAVILQLTTRAEKAEADALYHRTACDDLRNDLDAAQRTTEAAEAAAAEYHNAIKEQFIVVPSLPNTIWRCLNCGGGGVGPDTIEHGECILAVANPGQVLIDRLAKAEAACAEMTKFVDAIHAETTRTRGSDICAAFVRKVGEEYLPRWGRDPNPGQALLDELATLRKELAGPQVAAIELANWRDEAKRLRVIVDKFRACQDTREPAAYGLATWNTNKLDEAALAAKETA